MKVADIERFVSSLDEFDIPMRENVVLHISKDDATELAIDMYSSGFAGDTKKWAFYYIEGGIAYRLFRDVAMIYGMRIVVDE